MRCVQALQQREAQLRAELQEAQALLLEEQNIGQVLRQQLEQVDMEQEVGEGAGCARRHVCCCQAVALVERERSPACMHAALHSTGSDDRGAPICSHMGFVYHCAHRPHCMPSTCTMHILYSTSQSGAAEQHAAGPCFRRTQSC